MIACSLVERSVCSPFWDTAMYASHFDNSIINLSEGSTDITLQNNTYLAGNKSKFGPGCIYVGAEADAGAILSTGQSSVKTIEFFFLKTHTNTGGIFHALANGYVVGLSGTRLTIYAEGYKNKEGLHIIPNKWHHFAICIDATETRYYLNGVLIQTHGVYPTSSIYLFSGKGAYSINGFDGYIDDLKLHTSAIYTYDFIPRTREFKECYSPNGQLPPPWEEPEYCFWDTVAYASHCDGTVTDESRGAGSGSLVGTSSYATGLFDLGVLCSYDSNQGVSISLNSLFKARSISFFFKVPSFGTNRVGLINAQGNGFVIGIAEGGTRIYVHNGGDTDIYTTVSANIWHHLSIELDTQTRIYLNGTLIYTDSTVISISSLTLGSAGGAYAFYGLDGTIDDILISNGAQHSADFIPPTEPFVVDTCNAEIVPTV